MENPWISDPKLCCIIVCAGRGSRMLSVEQRPKTMVEINDRPILGYIIDYWKHFTDDFIFVVGYKKKEIIKFARSQSINSRFVEQRIPKGIGDALMQAKDFICERFIVILGDCICKGKFDFPLDMQQGIGVWKTKNTENIKRNYSVEIKHNYIYRVKEKPKRIINNLCGTGFYFFDKRIFRYIKRTKPSKLRNEVEITDVIQNMIDGKECIKPVFLKGAYLNITFPEDIQKAYDIIS